MNGDAVLAAGRAAAKARMRDTVRLVRPGPSVFDRETGEDVPGPPLVLYDGIGRVRAQQAASEDVQAGEHEVVLRHYIVSLPWAAVLPAGEQLLPGDQVEVIASQDARLTGRTLWVTDSEMGDQATAWRITAEDRS